jgi:hypothetical protein
MTQSRSRCRRDSRPSTQRVAGGNCTSSGRAWNGASVAIKVQEQRDSFRVAHPQTHRIPVLQQIGHGRKRQRTEREEANGGSTCTAAPLSSDVFSRMAETSAIRLPAQR